MGRLRQTSLWGTRSSPRLPRPLYAPRRHLQSPLAGIPGREGDLPVARPQPPQPPQKHAPRRPRVHPPLPPSHPSPAICQDPLLRLPLQPPSPRPAFPLPTASQCPTARNRYTTPRLEIPPPSPDWRVPGYLPYLP